MVPSFPRTFRLRKSAAIQKVKVINSRYIDRVNSLSLRRGGELVIWGWISRLPLWSNVLYFVLIGILCSDESIVPDSS